MKHDLLFAGFGGQGILLLGRVTAQAAMLEGNNVTFLPSYGPEMRGGTCHCCVVVSDYEIASPVLHDIDTLVAMNQPSCDKFGPRVRAGGLVIANRTLVESYPDLRPDCRMAAGPFTELAGELGDIRVCSMMALGRLVHETGIAAPETVCEQMRVMTAKRPELTALNERAFALGLACAQRVDGD